MRIVTADFSPWGQGLVLGNTHLVRRFIAEDHDVLWLSQFLHYGRFFSRRDEVSREFIDAWKRGPQKGPDGVWTFTPLSFLPHIDLPFLGGEFVGRRTMRWTWPSTRGVLKKCGFYEPDVLFLGIPRLASLMDVAKPKAVAYRMSDLFTGFLRQPVATEPLEREICRRSDVVFATAGPLVERAERWSDNVVYLPNGVDIERFSQGVEEPDVLKAIPHPRLLYVGAVGPWLDTELLGTIAERKRDAHLVIVGPVRGPAEVQVKLNGWLEEMTARPNVTCLGFQSPDLVTALMRHCDVGLIPFLAKELTHAISPIKLFEYAAAGMPVVSRDLEETRRPESPALFYETPEEALAAVEDAVSRREALSPEMRTFAERNTWDARYETVKTAFRDRGIMEPA